MRTKPRATEALESRIDEPRRRVDLRRPILSLACGAILCACGAPGPASPTGSWHATLHSPGGPLPFGLELGERDGTLRAFLINGSERIEVPRVEFDGSRLLLGIDHYDSSISATLDRRGERMDGNWRRTSAGANSETRLPFSAVRKVEARFPVEPGQADDLSSAERFAGRWTVDFEKSDDPAVAEFDVDDAGVVAATFLTTTGDYRFLAGNVHGDRLRLSVFDGAHAFLFDARLQDDGSLLGDFWSRDTWHESWTARLDPQANLADGFKQTRWVDGADLGALRYPDLDGTPRSLADPAFAGAARILLVFGTWCPNCTDATRHLVELHKRFRDRGLSIVGLAFEMTGDLERDTEQVRRYADYHGIDYPLLVAGLSDKTEATKAFPLIDQVRAFPTTVFLDAGGRVKAVHSGYSGPATGEAHRHLRERFEDLILEMLAESEAGGAEAPATGVDLAD